jgi:uncharacterized RDD family membrane protein YckC
MFPEQAIGYGGAFRRGGAALIDLLLLAPLTLVLDSLITTHSDVNFSMLVFAAAYEIGMTASSYQATLGKMAFGLKVADAEGRRLSVHRSVGRYLAKLLSLLPLAAGYLMIGFTQRKRGLHDMVAGTLVLRLEAGPAPRLPAAPMPRRGLSG